MESTEDNRSNNRSVRVLSVSPQIQDSIVAIIGKCLPTRVGERNRHSFLSSGLADDNVGLYRRLCGCEGGRGPGNPAHEAGTLGYRAGGQATVHAAEPGRNVTLR